MPIKPLFVALPLLALGLSGCLMGGSPVAVPPPSHGVAVGMPMPAPDLTSGPSLYDAHHQVQRYMTLHYEDAVMVRVQADQVGAQGRIGREGRWAFTYAVKHAVATGSTDPVPATGSLAPQAVEVPTYFETRYLTLVLTGDNQMLAPEASQVSDLHPMEFGRAIALTRIIEDAAQYGMSPGGGPFGLAVTLRGASDGGARYELEPSRSYAYPGPQQGYGAKPRAPMPGYGQSEMPAYGGEDVAMGAGKLIFDAYSGKLIARQ